MGFVQTSARKGSYGRFPHQPAAASASGPNIIFERRELGEATGEYPSTQRGYDFNTWRSGSVAASAEQGSQSLRLDKGDYHGADVPARR